MAFSGPAPCLFCGEGAKPGCSTLDGASLVGGESHVPHPAGHLSFNAVWDACGLSTHYWLTSSFLPAEMPNPSLQGFSRGILPVCTHNLPC